MLLPKLNGIQRQSVCTQHQYVDTNRDIIKTTQVTAPVPAISSMPSRGARVSFKLFKGAFGIQVWAYPRQMGLSFIREGCQWG